MPRSLSTYHVQYRYTFCHYTRTNWIRWSPMTSSQKSQSLPTGSTQSCAVLETPHGKKKARLCLDPKDLNKNITTQELSMTKLPALHGKKFSSVADTNKGYWITNRVCYAPFNTFFGRLHFKRLPFGVIVTQDIFQRKLDDVYKNTPDVTGIADDVTISGSTEKEHEQAFTHMLEASWMGNVGLNSEITVQATMGKLLW